MGHPIAHSRSPMLHGYWLKRYGIAGSYERLDIAPEAHRRLLRQLPRRGLDRRQRDGAAQAGGDPVSRPDRRRGAGHGRGEHDLVGGRQPGRRQHRRAWASSAISTNCARAGIASARRAVVLGAGGAARAAVYGLLARGLQVAIVQPDRCRRPKRWPAHFGGGVTGARARRPAGAAGRRPTCWSTATSLGMIGQPPLQLDLAPLKPDAIVYDVVYVPLETATPEGGAGAGTCGPSTGWACCCTRRSQGFRHWFGRDAGGDRGAPRSCWSTTSGRRRRAPEPATGAVPPGLMRRSARSIQPKAQSRYGAERRQRPGMDGASRTKGGRP